MESRSWIGEAEEILKEIYNVLVANSESGRGRQLKIEPALDTLESKYFILGMEAGLFSIDEGYVQTRFLAQPRQGETKQKMLQLFWHSRDSRFLFREGVCQLAAVSTLVLKHGWDISEIQLEPSSKRFGSLAYAVDIVVLSSTGKVLICGEVKRNDRELEKLIDNFRSCCARGKHDKSACECRSNHPKYEICVKEKPAYFWATSPGRERCFRLSYDKEIIHMNELECLPDRTQIQKTSGETNRDLRK